MTAAFELSAADSGRVPCVPSTSPFSGRKGGVQGPGWIPRSEEACLQATADRWSRRLIGLWRGRCNASACLQADALLSRFR